MQTEIEIEVPPVFHPSQFFTDLYPDDSPIIKLVRNGHTLKRHYVDPKGAAFRYADMVNDEPGGGVIRLTPKGVSPRAYVVVLKETPQQGVWGRKQKSLLEKRSDIFSS